MPEQWFSTNLTYYESCNFDYTAIYGFLHPINCLIIFHMAVWCLSRRLQGHSWLEKLERSSYFRLGALRACLQSNMTLLLWRYRAFHLLDGGHVDWTEFVVAQKTTIKCVESSVLGTGLWCLISIKDEEEKMYYIWSYSETDTNSAEDAIILLSFVGSGAWQLRK